jgi:AraC-like DNA-binding protein
MIYRGDDEGAAIDSTTSDNGAAVVRIDALRGFANMVSQLGGDPGALLAKSQIDPATLENRNAVISYRTMVHLLERASVELACPDFGMRLAAVQGGAKVLGPLEIVMKNSRNVGEAFRYCADHIQAYSTAAQICLEGNRAERRTFMRFDILLSRLPYQRQTVEQALLLTQHAGLNISSGQVRAREIWFSHEPLAPLPVYREYFGAILRFGQCANGLFFTDRDLACPIEDPDPQLYELATSFIDNRFPSTARTMSTRVRTIVARLLVAGKCTNERVASTLGMHPRTLQRRLREEGECFETIKDSVRRDVALRYLKQPEIPLTRVAEMLGYSEASVLSRSCYRWFAASPRQLRNQLTG